MGWVPLYMYGIPIALFAISLTFTLVGAAQAQSNVHPMKKIRTEILIDAPIETVWNVLIDREAWPTWNPFIIESTQPLILGKKIRNVMRNGARTLVFKPKITDFQPYKRLEWLGHLGIPGLFDGRHSFELQKLNGQTLLVQGEYFGGMLRKPIMKKIGQQTLENFMAMNQALKARCETR
jgi:hypothetical protein